VRAPCRARNDCRATGRGEDRNPEAMRHSRKPAASQNATKAMMMDMIAARWPDSGSVLGRSITPPGRRSLGGPTGCWIAEEALAAKRPERECR